MTVKTIERINPLIISGFKLYKFRRIGYHPSYTKLMKRKNPIRGLLGFYSPCLFDGTYQPHVVITGANGKDLRTIWCKSNDEAYRVQEDLYKQLNEFLEGLSIKHGTD